ncbi:tyrosine-type recombinase/integrase [Frisingicoccus caecimuris]|uniref:Site-specific recombinase XerD n=1 Tax=Frisingicoccus caecimuris TaxID=1796636 RepID=A0A4R2LCW4_9FIRM|nr:tyrosine-type recombinase/integrase [Frisingicoccus caecimuris]MCR1918815.1 tyrosine-type recombinase/integrase [Frisingicoccus caecimuris]TCO84441.1 site-specific recombinase XerD [Frisingicoccus caecimuris]
MEHFLNEAMIDEFRLRLEEEEKSSATIDKYIRDVRTFFAYAGVAESINKTTMIAYKEYLITKYAAASVNSMLTSVNIFLKEMNWHDCVVKILKIQQEAFRAKERDLTKEEYYQLVRTAERKGNIRLSLIMQTIGSTGIRISELKYITVAAINLGYASVCSKGKRRTVLLPEALCQKLKHYVREKKIQRGSVFVTRTGKNVDRSNVCHEMKALGREAGVMKKKIFPHNLRHLFALTYYRAKKDISHLADLLGHSNINTTRIYTLVSGEEQAKQIEFLGLVP